MCSANNPYDLADSTVGPDNSTGTYNTTYHIYHISHTVYLISLNITIGIWNETSESSAKYVTGFHCSNAPAEFNI
jgi:hypothetical protein